ncbi:metallophosphoesterase [Haloarculaceae archaeon H-GB11]|nr:metallophosphoesterase [Haloarculaceae archaeon H-GB11]
MDWTFADRAVYADGTLVVADLHLGREAAASVQVPVGGDEDVLDRLDDLVSRFDPEEVVLAGDVLHSFGSVPDAVGETVADLHDRIEAAGARPVVTPGNHDVHLDAVWKGATADAYRIGDAVICHGHERPSLDADAVVVGHDHPALAVEGQKRPCFLRGPAAGFREVVMLPAFDRLASGVVVNEMRGGAFQSPVIDDADALCPVVWDTEANQALEFPALATFRKLL